MSRGKKIYFMLLLLSVFITSTAFFSYAFFTSKNEEHGKLNIVVGTLNYKIESNELKNNRITISAGAYKNITVDITSLNDISSKYRLFYSFITELAASEKENFYVEYSYLSNDTSYQIIESKESSEVKITIINDTDRDVEIEFGIKGGFTNQEVVLNSSKLAINSFKHLIDYSGNNYYGTLLNGANIIYDNDEDMYALDFDGTDDYVDIVDLPETIDWSNGFTIEFEAKWDNFNRYSRILDFGNGSLNDNIVIYNNNEVNGLSFGYFIGETGIYTTIDDFWSIGQVNKYKIMLSKTDDGYNEYFYKDDDLIVQTLRTSDSIDNIERVNNYLGKSNWSNDGYFDGKIYNLTITEADGDMILYYNPSQKYKITNLVTNGSFEDDLTGWSVVNSTEINANTISETLNYDGIKSGKRIVSNVSGSNYFYQKLDWVNGHKYYYALYGYTTSATAQNIYSDINSRGGGISISVTQNSGWVKGSSIYTSNYTENRAISVNFAATTAETYVDGVHIIDLTRAFGLGNEPPREWLDKNINWFDGTKEVYKYDF